MEDEIRWKVTDPLGNEIVLYAHRTIDEIVIDGGMIYAASESR